MQQRGAGKYPSPPDFAPRHLAGCGELAHPLGAAHQQVGGIGQRKDFGGLLGREGGHGCPSTNFVIGSSAS